MAQWSDQVALVTGGARGIGRATAELLAKRGASVCVNYVSQAEAAETLAKELLAGGARAIAVGADVSDAKSVEAMVARTEAELGPITILVNNAGISLKATLDTFDEGDFARMNAINVDGVIHTTRAVMGGMRARRYGRIVNISSVAGIGTAAAGNAFYAATKAAVIILTRRFALELGAAGITVNAVAPGFVRTDMTEAKLSPEAWEQTRKQFAERAMMGRIGEAADIANAVAFFAAPEASWITGQVLAVDGGRLDYIGHG
ncbi:MAG TPA: glucose 1-dehydrogenase [Acetobacteraceae bacterium]|jgi:NAD(P)-dependent dehydrogenase (short-subunit alcohol dehydrogenase family)|nr:glucose 1-dehydrogenase [Acetobacteraceae bacterium]